MQVNVVSDTIQEFDGVRYYLCDRYFQKNGKRLHVAVWEALKGPVPEGWHVHHKDDDRANNQIDNLEALPGSDHLSHHMRQPDRIEQARQHIARIRPAAAVWHGSEEGRQWHSDHYHKNIAPLHNVMVNEVCEQCGGTFEISVVAAKRTKFCSNNCKSKWRRQSGVDNEDRSCTICNAGFSVNKYSKIKTCGEKTCAVESRKRTMGYA